MVLAQNIGTENHSNYNTREQIQACNELIGFDGVYKNVYDNRDALIGKSGVFFVIGDYVGKDNKFDLDYVPKLEKYCTWDEIHQMCETLKFKIGWHTWSHPDLTKLSRSEIMQEITPPFPMKYFAYPYGKFNNLVIDCVKEAEYEMAWSLTQGSQNPSEQDWCYKVYRPYL